jgi:hypothetical protein
MFKMLVHRSKKLLPAGALLALTMMFTTMPSASAPTKVLLQVSSRMIRVQSFQGRK